jgi:hypothetical protein
MSIGQPVVPARARLCVFCVHRKARVGILWILWGMRETATEHPMAGGTPHVSTDCCCFCCLKKGVVLGIVRIVRP